MNKVSKILSTAAACILSTSILASDEYHIKPLEIAPDVNGVDLMSGQYRPQLPVLSVPAAPNLNLQTLQKFDSKIIGTLYPTAQWDGITTTDRNETYSLTFGGSTSEYFSCLSYECTPANSTGSTLFGNMNTKRWTYTQGKTGVQVTYDKQSSFFDYTDSGFSNKSYEGTWYASQIRFPGGDTLTITYDTTTVSPVTYHRPVKVVSTTGYEMHISYQSNDISTGAGGWSKLRTAYIVKADTPSIKLAEFSHASNDGRFTDLSGRTFEYTGFSNALGSREIAGNYTFKLPSASTTATSVSSATRNYAGVSHNRFVTSVTHSGVPYNYTYASSTSIDRNKQFNSVTITGPEGYYRKLDMLVKGAPNPNQQVAADTDSLGNTTRYTYYGNSKIKTVEYPAGNKVEFTYDDLGNVTSKTMKAKPGSGLSDIVVSANYDLINCFRLTCFRPTYTIDGKGIRTDYTFDPEHGGMLTLLEPADASGKRRLTTNTYLGSRLIESKVCAQNECSGNNVQITKYTYWNGTQLPKTVTKTNGTGSLNQITTYDYDAAGRQIMVDGPLAGTDDAVYYRYDIVGRKTWEIGAKNAAGYRAAKKFYYRSQDDQVYKVETGTVTSPTSNSLVKNLIEDSSYDSYGLKIKTTLGSTSQTQSVVQMDYDGLNRSTCTATRMNPDSFNGLPASACNLGTEGSFGPDRIVRNFYDTNSRVVRTTSGYKTVDEGNDIRMDYTENGQVSIRIDGNENYTLYDYDGFDRLAKTTFMDNTYEQNTYDENSNVTSLRKRDGKVLNHYFDNRNQLKHTTVQGESTIYFTYDGLGRQKTVSRGTNSVSYVYDGLGRASSTTAGGRTLSYQYDIADRRTRLTHPDGYYVTYGYDNGGALTSIKEYGTTALVNYAYNSLGRLSTITRGNGKSSTLNYDAPGRLEDYNHAGINNTGFSYNPASQMISRDVTNNSYQIKIPNVGVQNYTTNLLNQYTDVDGKGVNYDLAGNLTSFDGWSYNYNAHNRLISANTSGTSLSLGYDATGRLSSTTLNGSTTHYLYDGDELIAEYNSSGSLLRRYVHGIAEDDPLVWLEGSGTANKKYLHADERGSIISETNNSGTVVTTHEYGPFGEPMNSSTSRFRYTGQILIPGTELYHYKARVYHPELGRFLQTDPIGYEDGMNWYAYVRNDPMSKVDPDGRSAKEKFKKIAEVSPLPTAANSAASIANTITEQISSDKQEPSKVMETIIENNPAHAALKKIPVVGVMIEKTLKSVLNPPSSEKMTTEQVREGNFDGRIRVKDIKKFTKRLQKKDSEPKKEPESEP